MAEWLRRLTRNQMGSPRAGSNPAGCEIKSFFFWGGGMFLRGFVDKKNCEFIIDIVSVISKTMCIFVQLDRNLQIKDPYSGAFLGDLELDHVRLSNKI